MRWLDTDGDGKLGPDEWQLAVELLGITAAEDELGHDVRRMQLTYLASTAYTRLTDINALQVSGAGMLGRDILYEGGPRFRGQPEPMRVVKVPEEARMRSFWGGSGDQGKGFDLRGRFSGETINNVPLRYKGNAHGVPWTATPPIAENLLGTLQACGGPQRTRNPLLNAMSSDPHLLEELPQATLRGNEVLSVRVPVEAFASGVMQFVTPDGQTMQVDLLLALAIEALALQTLLLLALAQRLVATSFFELLLLLLFSPALGFLAPPLFLPALLLLHLLIGMLHQCCPLGVGNLG
ncbi:hypothetical protein Ctob_003944 [Chrysochromulina tobinii]|uniref:EF-hand domain-containing protein n=1 Tax=Chrysochromulina tobinii TaxID=1460289 RepID=A0A0M0JBS3_9EUKA|nr:hypothetical protein Ctob_003944 [Chrysochromulina tobinii]|eukprot:KOO23827.1 hypothetical protein Ctob_003944 [Chrysochromulina sp. CCMP291]